MGKPNVAERILDQLDKAKQNGVENLESLYALADEVMAMERRWMPVADRLTGVASLNIDRPVEYVDELYVRIKALETALIGFRVRPGARTIPTGHFIGCNLRGPQGKCSSQCAQARAALDQENADV